MPRCTIPAMIASGFVLRGAGRVPCYSCVAMEELARIRHGFSTRAGGADSPAGNSLNLGFVPWDAPDRVEENRGRFLAALSLGSARLATLSQIHSDLVHIIEESGDQRNQREGDALMTRVPGIALGILVADCFPILLADPDSGAVAAVHSGWRGTASRILAKTVMALEARIGSRPAHLLAAVGPGIRACCFEVGTEVAQRVADSHPGADLALPLTDRPGKYLLNLPRALGIQLAQSGVQPDRVFDLGVCTRCNPQDFFSYRAEGPRAGRQMAVIARIDD